MLASHSALLGLALVPGAAEFLARTLDIELDLVSLVGQGILELCRLLLGRSSCQTGRIGRLERLSLILGQGRDLVTQLGVAVDLDDRDDGDCLFDWSLSLGLDRLPILAFDIFRWYWLDFPASERGRQGLARLNPQISLGVPQLG